jgi:Holliday junction resolvase
MVNTYDKGARAERELVKLLNADGNWLAYKPPRTKFGKHDIFCFDVIALPLNLSEHPMLIQLKSTPSHFYSARKELAEWLNATKLNTKNLIVAVFLREGVGKYRAYCLSNGESEDLYMDFKSRRYGKYREEKEGEK